MKITYRRAHAGDLARCSEIRGRTRDNAIDLATLVAIGVTEETWTPKLEQGMYEGFVAEANREVIGFCFGDTQTGEVLVLAILAGYEGAGIGRQLLKLITERLQAAGHTKIWLAAAPDPKMRAYGFYRHLGWLSTGMFNEFGDEILKYNINQAFA